MAKKFSCFSLAKRLFVSEAKSKAKKSRRWRWVFGRVKLKQHHALAAPRRSLTEAKEEQRKHALAVAIATAAAAEAAVAAADAAAQVVRLIGGHMSYSEYERWTQTLAAVKIQTAYRAHLARQALKALKGLVRLQAVIRGQIVRRKLITKTKCLTSITKIQSQVHHKRVPTVGESCIDGRKKQFLSPKREYEAKEMKIECSNQRSWDYSLSSKEDLKASRHQKQEATIKLKKHSFSYRETRNDRRLEEPLLNEETGLVLSHGDWVDVKTNRRREMEKTVKSSGHSNSTASDDASVTQVHKLRHVSKHYSMEELNLPFSLPRRSFSHPKHNSIGDETSLPNSPVFPSYMAATESAKARTRLTSTPKQHLGFLDTLSDSSSPCKLRLSSWTSSFHGEVMGNNVKSVTTKQKPNSPRGHLL